jgi:hypothetical protein
MSWLWPAGGNAIPGRVTHCQGKLDLPGIVQRTSHYGIPGWSHAARSYAYCYIQSADGHLHMHNPADTATSHHTWEGSLRTADRHGQPPSSSCPRSSLDPAADATICTCMVDMFPQLSATASPRATAASQDLSRSIEGSRHLPQLLSSHRRQGGKPGIVNAASLCFVGRRKLKRQPLSAIPLSQPQQSPPPHPKAATSSTEPLCDWPWQVRAAAVTKPHVRVVSTGAVLEARMAEELPS